MVSKRIYNGLKAMVGLNMTVHGSLKFGIAFFVAFGAPSARGLQPQPRTLAKIDGPFRLTGAPLRVTLPTGNSVRAALEQSNDATLFLVMRGLSAQHEPGTTFALYVDLPEHGSLEERELHRIGSLNFFGTATRRAAQGGDPSDDWRSYDLTAIARRLLAHGAPGAPLTLTIEPNGTPAPGSEATIGSISIVQR